MANTQMPETPKTRAAKNKQIDNLLSTVPGELADMSRQFGGYSINVIYLPELKAPTEAHFVVLGAGDTPTKLDEFTISLGDNPNQVLEILDHPTRYSEALLVYLGGKPRKE